jgi:hypothetical protein
MPVASHHQDPVEQQKSTIEKTINKQTYKFIGLLNDKPPQCGKIWNYSAYPVALLPLKSM